MAISLRTRLHSFCDLNLLDVMGTDNCSMMPPRYFGFILFLLTLRY